MCWSNSIGGSIASRIDMSESAVEEGIATHTGDGAAPESASSPAVSVFDARRQDRIPKSHLRNIQMLYENFSRSATSSLSAYLRNYISLHLAAVEQLSYREFLDGLPSCTSMACFGIQPYTGNVIVETSPSLTFPILEILLGGSGKPAEPAGRKLTEIEQSLLEGLFRIIAHDLSEAWKHTAHIDFALVSVGAEAQFLQAMSPAEAVLAAKIEARMGEATGAIHIVLPSMAVSAILQNIDRERSISKTDVPPEHEARVLHLIQNSRVTLEARLPAQQIRVRDLMSLETGDVLTLDLPIDAPLELALNGQPQFLGTIVAVESKRAVRLRSTSTA